MLGLVAHCLSSMLCIFFSSQDLRDFKAGAIFPFTELNRSL